jgi:HK97 family phage major capsid protein
MPEPATTVDDRELLEGFAVTMQDLNAHYKTAVDEIARQGTVTAETAEKIRAAEAKADDQGRKVEELGQRLAKGDERLEKLEGDLRLVKQRSYRPPGMSEGVQPGRMLTFGERFTQHEGYKDAGQWTGKFYKQITVQGRILHPYVERKAITEAGSGIVILPTRIGVYPVTPLQPLVMRDLLTVVPLTGTNAVEYVKEDWTYNAGYQVAEGDKKPEGNVVYTEKTAIVRTIAWFVKISRQMLADVPYIAATVDTRLIYGVAKKEEHEILYGDNAAGHLWGIMPQATQPGATVIGTLTNRIDEIMAAIAYLANLGYPPTAIVLNALTWASMAIQKNTMGGYILGGPPQSEAIPRLWGLPLVNTPEMAAGDYLVGQFPGNAILFDREATTVEVAFQNEDDFVRNLVTFRAEERITLAVINPSAFAKGPFRQPAVMGFEGAAAEKEAGKK